MKCIFCDEKIKEQSFMESENFMVICDISPAVPGHSLIIPKKHVSSIFELDKKEIIEMFNITKKATKYLLNFYKITDFNLVINQGKNAGQKVNHLHLHILPRNKDDSEEPADIPLKVAKKKKIFDRKILSENEVKKNVNNLKEFISQQ